jgi:hypothetical protein
LQVCFFGGILILDFILTSLTLSSTSDIDHAMFVLNVDLWSADGGREVNLVRSSSSSASSSAIQNTTSPIGSAADPNMGYYTTHAAPFSRDAYGQQVVAYGQDYQMQSGYSMGK